MKQDFIRCLELLTLLNIVCSEHILRAASDVVHRYVNPQIFGNILRSFDRRTASVMSLISKYPLRIPFGLDYGKFYKEDIFNFSSLSFSSSPAIFTQIEQEYRIQNGLSIMPCIQDEGADGSPRKCFPS